jgi:hypothetical protein
MPIDVPAVSLAELNRLTGNFGAGSLVGEGSYGRVYRAKLSTGEAAAVKVFDNGGSGQPEAEFCAQLSVVSRLRSEHFTQMLGYCLELNKRIVLYEFATNGSLYDILHGQKGAEPGPTLVSRNLGRRRWTWLGCSGACASSHHGEWSRSCALVAHDQARLLACFT